MIRFQPFKIPENICQRAGGFHQGVDLCVRKIVVFQRQQNILPNGILVSVIQNFFRGLIFQPVPEGFLLSKHFLIQCRIVLFVGHYRTSSWCFFCFG